MCREYCVRRRQQITQWSCRSTAIVEASSHFSHLQKTTSIYRGILERLVAEEDFEAEGFCVGHKAGEYKMPPIVKNSRGAMLTAALFTECN